MLDNIIYVLLIYNSNRCGSNIIEVQPFYLKSTSKLKIATRTSCENYRSYNITDNFYLDEIYPK